MEKLKKEFLLNVFLSSFIISALYSLLITNVDNPLVSNPSDVSAPDGFVIFTLFFLVFYPFHVLVCSLNYAVARIVGAGLSKRLIVFNVIGFVLIGAFSLITKEATWLFLIFSFIVFSIISIISNNRKAS